MAERWVVNASPVILLAKAEVIRLIPFHRRACLSRPPPLGLLNCRRKLVPGCATQTLLVCTCSSLIGSLS